MSNLSKTSKVVHQVRKAVPQLKAALPRHMEPDRFARIVVTAIRKTPKLVECDVVTILSSMLQAAQLGLEPENGLGHAYLIPYKRECQLQVGYKGLLDLVYRGGKVSSVRAKCVYEKDHFEYQEGAERKLVHRPSTDMDRGKMTHVYAVAELKDGSRDWEVMSRADVEKIKLSAPHSGNTPAWKNWYGEMAKKCVVKRLCKYLPVSIEVQRAVTLDNQAEAGKSQTFQTDVAGMLGEGREIEGSASGSNQKTEPSNVEVETDGSEEVPSSLDSLMTS